MFLINLTLSPCFPFSIAVFWPLYVFWSRGLNERKRTRNSSSHNRKNTELLIDSLSFLCAGWCAGVVVCVHCAYIRLRKSIIAWIWHQSDSLYSSFTFFCILRGYCFHWVHFTVLIVLQINFEACTRTKTHSLFTYVFLFTRRAERGIFVSVADFFFRATLLY